MSFSLQDACARKNIDKSKGFCASDGMATDSVSTAIIVSPIVYSRLRVYILRADHRVAARRPAASQADPARAQRPATASRDRSSSPQSGIEGHPS
ncbi:hypothetical protein EMIT0158MI4_10308 [Burkholderia ambifaria]